MGKRRYFPTGNQQKAFLDAMSKEGSEELMNFLSNAENLVRVKEVFLGGSIPQSLTPPTRTPWSKWDRNGWPPR